MSDDKLELKTIQVGNNNNVAGDVNTEMTPGNGACSEHEVSPLLPTPQVGDTSIADDCVDGAVVNNESSAVTSLQKESELQKVKHMLNKKVVWKLRVWMLLLIVLSLIIGISFLVCAVGQDDEDEKYDRSSFVVERFFRGNFTLANNSFTSHPDTQPDESERLLEQLKHQLTAVYSSSSALARYFSNVTINNFSDDTAQFELQFIIPSENEQLVRFTLSREMVKSVLLQHFYDQDSDAGEPYYVIPTSLSMEVWTVKT